MSIAFSSTADLSQRALLESFEAPDQAPADSADPAAPSADDDATQRAQQSATAAQVLVPWQQRMPPLAIDSPAFTIKPSAPSVQRDSRDGGGGRNGAGGGDAGSGGQGGGGASGRAPSSGNEGASGRDVPAAAASPSGADATILRPAVQPPGQTPLLVSPADEIILRPAVQPPGPTPMLVSPADEIVMRPAVQPWGRLIEPAPIKTVPIKTEPRSDLDIIDHAYRRGGWIDEAQAVFGERTPTQNRAATINTALAAATQPTVTGTAAAALGAAMQAATQAEPSASLAAVAAGRAGAATPVPAVASAALASAMAATPASAGTAAAVASAAATAAAVAPTRATAQPQPAQPQAPQPQQPTPTTAAAPGIDDAWAQDRRSAMGDVQQAYQTARAQAEAAGQFQTTVTESDESGSRTVVVFDEAAFTQAWLTTGTGASNAGLATLARLYGTADVQALVAQRRDVVDLALSRGASVGLYEGAPPAGHAMSSAQELQALDGILYSDINRVLVAQFGQGPVEPPRTALAQEQLRRYGQERYDQMLRIERAQAHIQGDFARALEQARNDPNSVGWHEVQEQVQVREGPVDESGQASGPTVTRTITRREFSVERFSEWYTRAPSPQELQALQADPTAAGSAELLSRMAFAQLYGAAHEVVVNLGSDESGQPMEQREVRFAVQMGGQQHELTLQGDRLVQRDFRTFNLNDPPRLRDSGAVFWNPLLGWSTHETNIKHRSDILETIVTMVIIAAVCYVSAGALGPMVAGALGATAGTIGAAVITGAVVGATSAVVSGAISGNFSWRNVLQGMVLGGVGGAMTFGVNALAQGAADGALQAAAAGDPTAWDAARSTMNTVRSVGAVVQGGITSELGGGDFGDGVLSALGSVAAGGVGNQVTQGLVDNQVVSESMARVVGGVVTAGVSSVIVNASGGDGDRALVSGLVDTGVGFLPPASSVVQPEPGSAADDRNGSDIESDAADAARREQEWVQQSDDITARRGAETAPAEVPGRAPDIGEDFAPVMPGSAGSGGQVEPTSGLTPPQSGTRSGTVDPVPAPAPAPQSTNGVDGSPSADEPPQASPPLDVELPWIPLAPLDSSAGSYSSTLSDSTGDSAGESDSERAAARQALRESEIAQQNATAGTRSALTPDSSAHQVRRGDTVERVAREHYGDNWRAGQAAIMGANDLRTNAEGSPLIREGQSLALPDLAPISEDHLRGLNREGGRITANNHAGLENARIEREAAANQAELDRFANRSTSATNGDVTAPQGMSPDEAYRVYMSYGGRSGADSLAPGANAGTDPAAIDYGDAATSMNGAVGSGDSGELMNRLRNAPLGVAETAYSGPHNAVVRVAGGAASLPFAIYDGVEAAVTGRAGSLSEAIDVAANTGAGVQEGFRERYGYRPTSEGAADIARTLQPVGEAIHGVVQGARNQSEALIGDGATTVLFGGVQAGLEISGTVTGLRAAAGLIDNGLAAAPARAALLDEMLPDAELRTNGPSGINELADGGARGVAVDAVAGHSLRDVNPGYGTPGRINNCANCAIATDATLAGRPAVAMPGEATSVADLTASLGRAPIDWLQRNTPEALTSTMENWGHGAQAIVFGDRGPDVGHFFNAHNQGGKVVFLDGQSGPVANLNTGFQRMWIIRTN